MGEITIRGKILKLETREIRNEKTIVMFAITDFTDTIMVKMFTRNEQLPEILAGIKKGAFLKIKGVTTIDKFDGELTIGSVVGIRKISDFTTTRKDTSPEKRVELHCHTKMSDMDGVSEAQALVARAHDWGHQAIAITDHGVVQAFPDANHYVERLDKEDPFKIIYGVEAYLVDDLTEIAVNEQGQTLDDTFVVFDIETTGFSAAEDRIIEIGAVKITDGAIVDRFSTFVNPEVPIPFEIQQLTHITDDMVLEAPKIEEALPAFLDFVGESALVAHNAGFDVGFIEQNCVRLGRSRIFTSVDTVGLARVLLPTLSKYKLNIVAKALNISLENHHRAVDDAAATAEIYVKFIEMLKERGMTTLKEVNAFGDMNPDAIKKMPTYHAIILAKNEVGRVNLYTLVSLSHLKYFARRPRIPKSEFNKYREGLILGSACEAGELYRALLDGKSEETIAKIVDYYDYLEIQPIGNNAFMIASEKQRNIKSEEDLKNMNRRIVQLGEKFQKPVVATCDVHFMDPDSEVYRRIIMTGKGFSDADETIAAANREGIDFRGCLYGGFMLTPQGPKVIEYNARFGDPETEVLMPRLKSDLVEVMLACAEQRLDEVELEWRDEWAVSVVLTSAGYPGSYEKGKVITGIEDAAAMENVTVYHAGTAVNEDGELVTSGGRVLDVTALGETFEAARDLAYAACEKIDFEGKTLRRDIGLRALRGRDAWDA